ncbi:MAG: hypothetical protein P1S60_18730, partial [Anaerolineae bacterium]|nr:hypothetical protein [Anaerolineae bacterium]
MRVKRLVTVLALSFITLTAFYASVAMAQELASQPARIPEADVYPVLQGRVYQGQVGNETVPLPGVKVALYGANNPDTDPGVYITMTQTDAAGWYGLPVSGRYEYYNIREIDPQDKVSVGATSVSGAVRTANWIQYAVHLDDLVLTGNKFWDNPRPVEWGKWVNGEAWVPGISVTSETSDTIVVVDVIRGWPTEDLQLVEKWNPAHLKLLDWAVAPAASHTITAVNGLTITIPEGGQVFTVTKWFHVEPCRWLETTLAESVIYGEKLIDAKQMEIDKMLPVLWIDGSSVPDVYAGDVVSFTLEYGNLGGYENNVMIRNTFPVTAPFVHSDPLPDLVSPDGTLVEWYVGDLALNSNSSIDVVVAINETLFPSTTVTIQDWIYDHTGEAVDMTEISYHVVERPPDLIWDKWVNGIVYDPDLVVTVETSDTIEIVDVVVTPMLEPAILVERWDPAQLDLLQLVIEPEPDPSMVIVEPGRVEITMLEGTNIFTITKTFHVEPCTWRATFIEELLHKPSTP